MCDIKWGDKSISCARTNTEIDVLIKHADKVLYIFHAAMLYLQQVSANLLHNSFLLSINSWRYIGLTYWPTSGSVLWHVQCTFLFISQNFQKLLNCCCVYSSQNQSCAMYVDCRNKIDTSSNMGNWYHLKIIQKIPEQHTKKARHQGTTENSHTGHCSHILKSTNVKFSRSYRASWYYQSYLFTNECTSDCLKKNIKIYIASAHYHIHTSTRTYQYMRSHHHWINHMSMYHNWLLTKCNFSKHG